VSHRDQRIVSDLNSTYLSAEVMADIARLGIDLAEGAPLTVCDYDADEGSPHLARHQRHRSLRPAMPSLANRLHR